MMTWTRCLLAALLPTLLPTLLLACPDLCLCPFTASIVQCVNLTSPPPGLPATTTHLYIEASHLGEMPADSFSSYPNLVTLGLSNCGVRDIGHNAFSGLVRLTSLDLRWNQIERLSSRAFSGLSALTKLQLHHNNIRVIDDLAFHGLALSQLGLDGNTELSEIKMSAFYNASVEYVTVFNSSLRSQSLSALRPLRSRLTKLAIRNNRLPLQIPNTLFEGFTFRELRLNNNGLRSVDFLEQVSCRRLLSLSGNPTGPVDFSRYSGLQQLEALEVENTGFSEVRSSYFSSMTHLRKLNLANNGLTNLPEGLQATFSNLDWLGVASNPLHCNCELIWFKNWISSEKPSMNVECATPRRALITDLSDAYMSCSAPTILPGLQTSWNVSEGSSVVLTCIGEGDPAPSVHWLGPNNTRLTVQAPSNRSETQNQAILHLNSPHSDALYTCLVYSLAGNDSVEVTLTTHDAGYIVVAPDNGGRRIGSLLSSLLLLVITIHHL